MSNCPCCGRLLLRHIHHGNLHWFCPNCRQEMPNFDKQESFTSIRKVNLGKKPITAEVPPYKCTKNTLKRFSSKSYSDRLPRMCTHVEY